MLNAYQIGMLTHRTCGREKEYSVSSKRRRGNGHWHQLDEAGDAAQRILHTHSPYRNNQESEFLRNAARLYDDYGKLEYATAECTSPLECAVYDKADDKIIADMAQQACRDGEVLDVHNDNSDGLVSYGCHSSYQILRLAQGQTLKQNLLTFLVATGAVLFGAGEYKEGRFYHSSRAQFMDKDVGEKTRHGMRAILNTRSEPLLTSPHRDIYTRLHITSLDTKVSEVATFLEMALTSLFISMSEAGWDVSLYQPKHPVRALKDTSLDIHHIIETNDGKKVTALNIQEFLFENLEMFLTYAGGYCELPTWVEQAKRLWAEAIADLRTYSVEEWPPSSFWIDWWAKLHLLQEYQENCGEIEPEMLATLATEYHNIDPAKSLAHEMAQDGLLHQPSLPAKIEQAALEPTSHPRAQRRAYRIKQDSPTHKVTRVRWEDVTVNGKLRVLEFD
ncbi:MAG: proteasome accessory factor PafA2 family protein [Abitibacteriaceae bacterium]|nr:proteasome accessory factor PafA2 family protein [Abditibacteriaceae bacterium]